MSKCLNFTLQMCGINTNSIICLHHCVKIILFFLINMQMYAARCSRIRSNVSEV